MEHLLTNEIFMIFLSLTFLEEQMKIFGKLDGITKMKVPPSTISYIKGFSSELHGVEAGWSAVVVIYAVLNVFLLVALLSGHGPFLIVLRPSLVYPELITNAAILIGNHLACGGLPRLNPKLFACALSSSAKIIGIAMGIFRWIATFWIWWVAPAATDAVCRVSGSSSAETIALCRQPQQNGRNSSAAVRTALPLRTSGSDANLRKALRRRLTKSMAPESHIMSQISHVPVDSTSGGALYELESPWRTSRSMNSILESIILEDWENEAWDQPPAIRAKRRLASHPETSTSKPLHFVGHVDKGVGAGGGTSEVEAAREREDVRRACRVISVAMAPESVVMGWQQCAPMNVRMNGPAFYDDWRFLLWDVRALYARRDVNSVLEEYALLERLCDEVLESRCGPRISLSTGSMEEDDDRSLEAVEARELTPGERADQVLGIRDAPDRSRHQHRRSLISVESYLFARFANVLGGCSFTDTSHGPDEELPPLPVEISESKDKGVQVNTLPESAIRRFFDGEGVLGHRGNGVREVSSRDAFVQVSTLPLKYLKPKFV